MPGWLVLAGLLSVQTALSWAGQAERVRFAGLDFVAYWVDLESDELSLCWRDAAGKQLGTFTRLSEHLAARSKELKFAINAGIYSREGAPVGLHVEDGRTLRPLNLGDGESGQWNFYLKPNGVFYVAEGKPGIAESAQFAKLELRPSLACQSGPLLVSDGKIHPAFQPDSKNLHWRSGVGVTRDGRLVFAISKQALRFYDFARLFKEPLRCDHALYLDGDICAIYLPEFGHRADDTSTRFAGMFAVTAKPKAGPPSPK
ncbi:MAG: phosphodiester glycosidase family protein [Verrucomicrobia bacterium]|nr:phosphodiester glycosidase family protein [Verrucomicrobiota bacterium]